MGEQPSNTPRPARSPRVSWENVAVDRRDTTSVDVPRMRRALGATVTQMTYLSRDTGFRMHLRTNADMRTMYAAIARDARALADMLDDALDESPAS